MRIAIEGDGRGLMTKDFRECLYVYAALQRAGGEGMAQRVKSLVRDMQSFQEQFKTSLVRADGNGFSVRRDHEGRMALFLYTFEDRQQLFWQRHQPSGMNRFRLVNDKPISAVVARLIDG